MENRYKLLLYNKTVYKEVEISPEQKTLSIGTFYDNDVRLKKDLFFEGFFISVFQKNEQWNLECSSNIYIDSGDIRKQFHWELYHGTQVLLRYQESDHEFLKVVFLIDFDYENKQYDFAVQVPAGSRFSIGGAANCNICLSGDYVSSDLIEVYAKDHELNLNILNSAYGVCMNGLKVERNAVLHDYDFFSVANYYFYFKNNILYTDFDPKTVIRGLNCYQEQLSSPFAYPCFNRNTRMKLVIPNDAIQVLDPPDRPEKPKNNLLMSVLPAVVMLILTIAIRGMMGGGGAFVIFSACTIVMGIITSIVTYQQGKKGYQESVENRQSAYTEYIEQKKAEITRSRELEQNLLEQIYPNLHTVMDRIRGFSGDLFDRMPEDDDYLCIRMGIGFTEAARKIVYKNQEKFVSDDELSYYPEQIANEFRYMDHSPVVLELKNANAIGIVGDEQSLEETAANMTVDLAGRHYFGDVQFVYILKEEQKKNFSWIRFLPHVKGEGSMARNIACDADSRTVLFEMLYKEFSYRQEKIKKNEKIERSHWVIFVLDGSKIMTHPLSKFIADAARIQVTFVFFEKQKEKLPLWCSSLVYVGQRKGEIVSAADSNQKTAFYYQPVSVNDAAIMAAKLAPVYCEEVNLEGNLVKNITLFELLGIFSVEDLDLKSRWENSEVYRSMAAPLGVKTKKEIVYLDIHEKAHGPHGLVAGTTGSGKSEILQSYILSMTTLFHPYEVGFVIIDFKGGGMANQFANLPHLMGTITNIDGKQIQRSLLSIKAELLKRQNCFAQAEVNHIDRYILKYKNKEVSVPLPHLIIIVDEFAELRAEFPDFMKELISAARIGRSLGVHLILATQKPSGQVNEQIWSNSRFKLCLKVQSPEDSNEMIKSPLAAEILEPGRAYFQVGNNEIFELFQSGYSGAPEKNSADSVSSREYSISSVSFEGKRKCIFERKKQGETEINVTQLEALVSYVAGYCKEMGIEKLSGICLPPLPEVLYYPQQIERAEGAGIQAEIGILDDPNRQSQKETSLDITQENTLIIGSSQYGKTNLLQTIIRGLTCCYSPEEVQIYILDFGSMVLRNFVDLHHVGGVVTPSEDEKFKNLFRMLQEEINIRKEKLMKAGVSSFLSYREAGMRELPQIVLLVDNFTAVKEFCLQEEDPLLAICREGTAVGISVILSNQQTAGLGYRYMANFAKRIVLYCNENSEYSSVIDKCRTAPDNLPGRALTEIDRQIYEIHTYLSFDGEKEIDRVLNMKKFVEQMNEKYPRASARKIPEIPPILEEKVFENEYGIDRKNTYQIPIGLTYDTIAPLAINLLQQGMFSIIGRAESGKKNLLRVLMDHLYRNVFTCPSEVYIVDGVDRRLREFEAYGNVQEYTIDSNDLIEYLEEIHKELTERYERVNDGESLDMEPLKLIIVRNQDAIPTLCKNTAAMKLYKELSGKLKAMKVCFIFMDVENAPVSYSGPEILKSIKDGKNFFFFDDLQNLKICDISGATLRKFKKKIMLGDCYWLSGNEIEKLKIVKAEK